MNKKLLQPPKRRVGVIVPAINRVVEREWQWALPSDVQMYVSRARYHHHVADPLQGLIDDAKEACEDLKQCDVQLGVFACTAASFYRGPTGNLDLTGELSARMGVPVITASSAIVDALNIVQAKSICLVTPYQSDDVEREIQYLAGHHISVRKAYGMGIENPRDESDVLYERTYASVRENWEAGADALLISCTNLFSWSLVPTLEVELGVPVVTSNQACVLSALRALKCLSLDTSKFGGVFGLDKQT